MKKSSCSKRKSPKDTQKEARPTAMRKRKLDDCVDPQAVLMEATKVGNLSVVKNIIENHQDINLNSWHKLDAPPPVIKETPLTLASRLDARTDILECLLTSGRVQVNKQNSAGQHPLHIAVTKGCISSIRLLIQHGADLNKASQDRQVPLVVAVQSKRPDILQLLLEAGSNPDVKSADGTALLVAVQMSDVTSVQLLLRHGADPDGGVFCGSPLAHAMWKGDDVMAKMLIDAGASLETVTEKHPLYYPCDMPESWFYAQKMWTPLHMACCHGNMDMVKLLVQKGADVNKPMENGDPSYEDTRGDTPLNIAIFIGHKELIEYLLESNPVTGDEGYRVPAISAAIEYDNTKNKSYVKWNQYDFQFDTAGVAAPTCTHEPVKDAVEMVKILTRHAQVEFDAELIPAIKYGHELKVTPLSHACALGNMVLVEYLLEQGVDINHIDAGHGTPIYYACANRHHDLAKYLVQSGAKHVHVEGEPPMRCALLEAIYAGDADLVRYLLDADFPAEETVSEKTSSKVTAQIRLRTPLSAACLDGHTEIAKMLLEAGADPNQQVTKSCKRGGHIKREVHTLGCLLYAVEGGDAELAQLLIDYGADVNYRDEDNHWTPLHAACYNRKSDVISVLLKAGVDVNTRDTINGRVLELAVCGLRDGDPMVYDLARLTFDRRVRDDTIVSGDDEYVPMAKALGDAKHKTARLLVEAGLDLGLEKWYLQRNFGILGVYGHFEESLWDFFDEHYRSTQSLKTLCRRLILSHPRFVGLHLVRDLKLPRLIVNLLKLNHT